MKDIGMFIEVPIRQRERQHISKLMTMKVKFNWFLIKAMNNYIYARIPFQ